MKKILLAFIFVLIAVTTYAVNPDDFIDSEFLSMKPEPGEVWIDPLTGMEFVWVPKGCFMLGSKSDYSNKLKSVKVCLDGFWIGKYEVTFAQYRKFMLATGDTRWVDWDSYTCPFEKDGKFSLSGFSSSFYENQPMVEVRIEGAQAMADWMSGQGLGSFRLPSEAQWEYAAKSAGHNQKYSGSDNADDVAWYAGNSGDGSHEVGQKKPNGLGIHDMSGNVWEWTGYWFDYDDYTSESGKHSMKKANYLVVRGGSHRAPMVESSCTYRGTYPPGKGCDDVGFRLIRLADN